MAFPFIRPVWSGVVQALEPPR